MKIVQETTVWKDVERQPNHVYLMDGDRAYAYSKWGEGPAEYFKKPLRLDRRGRKFIELKQNKWKFKIDIKTDLEDIPKGQTWTVNGSKGSQYTVSLSNNNWSCTCPGHVYRGKCRHIDEIRQSNMV